MLKTRPISLQVTNFVEFAGLRPANSTKKRSAQALDDRRVGHAAALAHGLQAPAAAGALELVEQCGHELGAGAAERVTEGDGAAVRVHLAHVRVVLLLP